MKRREFIASLGAALAFPKVVHGQQPAVAIGVPLAELATKTHIARLFVDDIIAKVVAGTLDTVTASMAKYWITEVQAKIVDVCLQCFGGYGYMLDYPISEMYKDARGYRIYGGSNEIMKLIIARSL